VSASIYLFLVGLSLWKWLLGTCFLWTCFLFKLSRMKLQLMVSHPDKHAGIGFLGMSTVAFAPIAFAIAAAVGVTWRYEILYTDASLLSFKMPAILLLVLVLLLAVGPLLFFVPKLAPLRRKGILQYGSLAPEISSLTDLASSFQNIEAMKPLPLDKGSLVAPAAAVLIGLFPAILAQVPLKVIFKSLLHAMK
jgi:glucan phosphoethanolaminetransferase (alkaline phosphatase superfamily)